MTRVKKRSFLWWIIGGVLVASISLGAIWWYTHRTNSQSHVQSLPTSAQRDQTIRQFEANKDINGAVKYYEQLIKQASNSDDKRTLLLEESNLLIRAKQYDKALSLLNQTEAIKASVDVVIQRAIIYEIQGDKAAAAAQYTKALDMTKDANNGHGDRDAPLWRAKIKGLQS